MKAFSNDKYIERNKKMGKTITYVALGTLGVGFLISMFQPDLILWAYLALIVGFMLSQMGITLTNQWGTSPRPDEKVTKGLKGLSNDYKLYNFLTPIPQLLVGPSGIWILAAFHQRGDISYDEKKNKWVQKNVNMFLRIFSQESLGRPDPIVRSYEKDLQKFFSKEFPDLELPEVKSALVFTSDLANVDAPNAKIPTLHASKLKDFMRKQAKENPADMETIQILQKMLIGENKPE